MQFKSFLLRFLCILCFLIYGAGTTVLAQRGEEQAEKGYQYMIAGDYKKAVEQLNHAIRLNPKLTRAYYNRAYSKIEMKLLEEGIADYTEAIALNPVYTSAYFNRGLAKKELEDYKGALADFEKVVKLDANHTKAANQVSLTRTKLKKGGTPSLSPANSDWNKLALLGRAKSMQEVRKRADSYDKVLKDKAAERYIFNENGFTTAWAKYYLNEFEAEEAYSYNSNNQLSEKVVFEKDGTIDEKIVYNYNGKGKLVREITYWGGDRLYKVIEYFYDNKGHEIKKKELNADGELRDENTKKYDSQGNRIESASSLFGIGFRYFYKFDDNGNEIEQKRYSNNKLLFTDNYTYDKKNRLTGHVVYTDGAMFSKEKMIYNTEGKLKEKLNYNSRGELMTWETWAFDGAGNTTLHKSYYGEQLKYMTRYKYEYDAAGNWIKQEMFTDNSETSETTILRTIEYYE